MKKLLLLSVFFGASGLLNCAPNEQISQISQSPSDTTKPTLPRFPFVLHHGLLGFDKILSIDYYYGIPKMLRDEGVTVFTTRVAPVATVAVRAQQLAAQIDQILETTGAAKVNLIAHSMGGLDSRYLISTLGYGDRVASLTTIASPHDGTAIADLIHAAVTTDKEKLFKSFIWLITGHEKQPEEQSLLESYTPWDVTGVSWNLSTEFVRKHFNPANPDDSRVYYQSYSAMASALGGRGRPPKVEQFFLPIFEYLSLTQGLNDGLVPTLSARHGLDRGVINGDHLNVIGQIAGITGGQFDHVVFYQKLVEELASRGF